MSIDQDELTSTEAAGLYQSVGAGHHTCWYPVGLSAELANGQVRGIDLCDGRIVVFRGDDGVARAMLPYCAHMGADLSVGDVVGNDIRCAFHHWQYGGDGRCTKIATGDRIPGAAVVRTLPLEEHDGLLWVWWGDSPTYPVPSFSSFTDGAWARRTFEVPLTTEVHIEPWVFAANVMDFQHLKSLHNVDVGSPAVDWNEWGAAMKWSFSRPEVGEINWDIELFGTNSVRSVQPQADGTIIGHIATTVPMGKQGTKVFIVLVTNDIDHSDTILDHQAEMHTNIANEDMDVLSTIRVGKANFTSSDKKLVQYMRYQRDYPKATMAELERGTASAAT
jgi:phenylpropionate dioxygenase-like ring-hydroxylating dioxygenase large terminal subunit